MLGYVRLMLGLNRKPNMVKTLYLCVFSGLMLGC